MATKQETVDFIIDQLSVVSTIRARKMFGEYALYCDEKVVALICDDILFVKMTETGLTFIDDPIGVPPYPGAKHYLCVSPEKLEDARWLTNFIQQTADTLPPPKSKNKK
jgi:TfoX/Sxy family transcriptional regulator of competence genes